MERLELWKGRKTTRGRSYGFGGSIPGENGLIAWVEWGGLCGIEEQEQPTQVALVSFWACFLKVGLRILGLER